MVGNEKEKNDKNNVLRITKNVLLNTINYLDTITTLDLSNRNISSFNAEEFDRILNICHLNISNNKLTEVPETVINLKNLITLDISYNSIVFFDDTPSFCHTLERLDLSNNRLEGPPLWVWVEKPKSLVCLNISNNRYISTSFNDGYFKELLHYTTLVNEIDVHNCHLHKYMKLMATFCNASIIKLGNTLLDLAAMNCLNYVPCEGLEKCVDVEQLDLSNTQIYNIKPNIEIYKHLKELNLSQNNINSLPDEFSNLESLHTCILSCNKLLYLPENMYKLTKLVKLYLDNNELCMLPETLQEIPCLKTLDLYDNHLCEGFNTINNLEELDFAQNYFEELNDEEYLIKKKKLRQNYADRMDGRKMEVMREENESSSLLTDDEAELCADLSDGCAHEDQPESRSSTPEDWDSDNHWIPQYYNTKTPHRSPWLFFIKRKIEEGNFCPIDAHPISISDKVKYEKMCNPQPAHESDGQFDDYSDDDS